jgi:4-amino-4-deoxy-L-arabinose transferase-like glycosyltransferase
MGVLAVLALYLIVTRRFGPLAGIASALVLAVFPAFVAVSRDNNLDAMLILLMVLACGTGLRAIETGRLRWLLLCAVLVGLAFNTKTLAAYLVVPGLAAAYLVCAPISLPRRLLSLTAAGLVLVVVSLAWLAFIDLTPKSQRPFVIATNDNSVLSLVFGYNGIGRIGGEVGGPGRIPGAQPKPKNAPRPAPAPGAARPNGAHRGRRRNAHPIAFGGPTGPLRLFGSGLGGQGGWMLPFALLGAIATALTLRARRDPRTAGLIVLGVWSLIEAATLSFSKGIVHPYYVSALAPGAAAMCGMGLGSMAQLVRRSRWWVPLAAAACAGTIAAQAVLLHRDDYLRWDIPLAAAGCAVAIVAVLIRRGLAKPALALALAVLLVAPTAYASTLWSAPVEGTFPAAGPYQAAGSGGVGVPSGSLRINLSLIDYLHHHHPGTRFVLLTVASTTAAPLILLGLPAAALAGYSGTDPALSPRGLAGFLRRGEARYVMLGGAYSSRGGTDATHAVARDCRQVPQRAWRPPDSAPPKPGPTVLALYDCKGREAQLAGTAPVRAKSAAHRSARSRRASSHRRRL